MILISAALFLAALIIPFGRFLPEKTAEYATMALFLASYLISGWKVLSKAVRNIRNGQVFDENFLMAVASLGAIALKDFKEAAAVMLFYQVGELFEDYAVDRSRESIAAIMDMRPDSANLLRDGEIEEVDPEEVEPDDIIVIKPANVFPWTGSSLRVNPVSIPWR